MSTKNRAHQYAVTGGFASGAAWLSAVGEGPLGSDSFTVVHVGLTLDHDAPTSGNMVLSGSTNLTSGKGWAIRLANRTSHYEVTGANTVNAGTALNLATSVQDDETYAISKVAEGARNPPYIIVLTYDGLDLKMWVNGRGPLVAVGDSPAEASTVAFALGARAALTSNAPSEGVLALLASDSYMLPHTEVSAYVRSVREALELGKDIPGFNPVPGVQDWYWDARDIVGRRWSDRYNGVELLRQSTRVYERPALTFEVGEPAPLFHYEDVRNTFTRSKQASAMDGVGAVRWWDVNQLRKEDRGDGYGPQYLFEGPATNILTAPEDFADAFWQQAALTQLSNTELAPDGDLDAFLFRKTDATSNSLQPDGVAPAAMLENETYTVSGWLRAKLDSAGDMLLICNLDSLGGGWTGTASIDRVFHWERLAATGDSGSGAAPAGPVLGANFGDNSSEFMVAMAQMEQEYFPTSYIDQTRMSGFRSADNLQVPNTVLTSEKLNGRWEVDVYPYFSSDDNKAGYNRYLLSAPAGHPADGLLFVEDADRVRVISGGTTLATLTIAGVKSRHEKMTIGVDMQRGILRANNDYTTFTPVPWDISQGVRWGGYTGSGEFGAFCRMSLPRKWGR